MRTLLLSLLAAVVALMAFAADLPPLPESVTLANGKTLHEVSVVRYEPGRVVLKYRGGAAGFRFEHLRKDHAEIFRAHARAAEARTAQSAPAKTQRYEGQVFIQTVGAGPYKFGGTKVRVFAMEQRAAFDSIGEIRPGAPILTAITDADGRFRFELPADRDFFLFAQAYRYHPTYPRSGSDEHETYQWILSRTEIEDPSAIMLTGRNAMAAQKVIVEE